MRDRDPARELALAAVERVIVGFAPNWDGRGFLWWAARWGKDVKTARADVYGGSTRYLQELLGSMLRTKDDAPTAQSAPPPLVVLMQDPPK